MGTLGPSPLLYPIYFSHFLSNMMISVPVPFPLNLSFLRFQLSGYHSLLAISFRPSPLILPRHAFKPLRFYLLSFPSLFTFLLRPSFPLLPHSQATTFPLYLPYISKSTSSLIPPPTLLLSAFFPLPPTFQPFLPLPSLSPP